MSIVSATINQATSALRTSIESRPVCLVTALVVGFLGTLVGGPALGGGAALAIFSTSEVCRKDTMVREAQLESRELSRDKLALVGKVNSLLRDEGEWLDLERLDREPKLEDSSPGEPFETNSDQPGAPILVHSEIQTDSPKRIVILAPSVKANSHKNLVRLLNSRPIESVSGHKKIKIKSE